MTDPRNKVDTKKLDTKEFELPETLYIRDIENKVFQGIVLQCLGRIDGIGLIEGNFIDSILGRGGENVKGIIAEQDSKSHSVSIKLELNVCYGVSIPEKAEEIQSVIAEEITRLTGLHVSCVHIVFKNVISYEQLKKLNSSSTAAKPAPEAFVEEEYNDEF